MEASLFEFSDYKLYLSNWIASRPNGGHGEKSKLAAAMSCHLAYVSQVLGGDAHLSHEQAIAAGDYLGLTEEELAFLLLLLDRARAGSARLRQFYDKKIRGVLAGRSVLKNRLEYQKTLPREDQTLYYSAWYYIAAHMLITMPAFQSRSALEARLGLGTEKLLEVLEFLARSGLAAQSKGKLSTGPMSIHLGNDSPMISKHHANWRMKAIQSLEREKPEELHYSSVVTVARSDIPKARKILLKAIEEMRKLIKDSKEDALYCYCLDLFEV